MCARCNPTPTPNHELNMKLELQDPTLPLEHCAEYDAAAEYFARHNKLPDCMGSPGAIDYINADPEAFEQRVREFKYAHCYECR